MKWIEAAPGINLLPGEHAYKSNQDCNVWLRIESWHSGGKYTECTSQRKLENWKKKEVISAVVCVSTARWTVQCINFLQSCDRFIYALIISPNYDDNFSHLQTFPVLIKKLNPYWTCVNRSRHVGTDASRRKVQRRMAKMKCNPPLHTHPSIREQR